MEKTIKSYLKGKTIIMPTHATKFISRADNVVIMDKGRIIKMGTYS